MSPKPANNSMNGNAHHNNDPALILVSCTQACEGLHPEQILRYAQGEQRFYWAEPGGKYSLTAFGVVAELSAWGPERFHDIEEQASDLFHGCILVGDPPPEAVPRVFGGFSFQEDFAPDNTWSVYTPANFFLPHYQLTVTPKAQWLTMNVQISTDENLNEIVPQLQDALAHRCEELRDFAPTEIRREMALETLNFPMDFDTWEQIINQSTERIRHGELKKVVLARACELKFESRVEVENALDYLNDAYSDSYRFLLEPRPYHSFYGATPELLASVRRDELETMGLAGSIRRGKDPEDDELLATQLCNDPKEREEHALVVEAIQKRLKPISTNLQIADMRILKLHNIQHLHTPIHAELDDEYTILKIVEKLHPTPALGGSPREIATGIIQEYETIPRGWYASPVGWINHRLEGKMIVAIRSAVSQERRVWTYAGAGIVADSKPEKEWAETNLKFRPMFEALGLDMGVLSERS